AVLGRRESRREGRGQHEHDCLVGTHRFSLLWIWTGTISSAPEMSRFARSCFAALAAVAGLALLGASAEIRSGDRLASALTGARLIVGPGKVFDPGVVVVRGGVIEAVGSEGSVRVPADARVYDLKGKTVHAAFVDPYASADRLAGRRPPQPR